VTTDGTEPGALQCRCLWRGERCTNQATQEDGLCNWCGENRTEHSLRKDPAAHIGPDGTYFGLSGRGQTHDYDVNKPASTAACWYPNADRTVLDA
jgi:hypothetical protein